VSARGVTESVVEQAALAWLESIGWQITHGPGAAPATPAPEVTR
jgi:type I restriction enzyme R subunit